ncbi:MAG TPA: MATE family efflux transporter, partial [Burkholderiales bacterium]|nr:MATE family efflux transporter [Burkholderiales bacterium]
MSVISSGDRRTRLLTGPVLSTLAGLAAPNVLLSLMQALVSFADAWFIGRLGTEGLAGVALVFPMLVLMQMMSAGAMGGGVSSAIARALGAGDVARAERLALHAAVIAIAFGLLFTVAMMLAGPALFQLLGGSGAALAHAIAYSNIVFGGALTVWLCNIFGNIVRGTGNMTVPAIILSSAALLQIPLCGALV